MPLAKLANVQNCIEALCQPDCVIKRQEILKDVGIQRLMIGKCSGLIGRMSRGKMGKVCA
jgi:hypothetical protein